MAAVALPAGLASEQLARLDEAGMGLARARVAARLGNPGPFAQRAELAAQVDNPALRAAVQGEPLTADRADAVLLRAALESGADPAAIGLVGLFAGRAPGPHTRAVPIDRDLPVLRFPHGASPPPAAWGALQTWSTAQIGDEPSATVRVAHALPGGGVALGSDYGLTLWREGRFEPFPWPAGARREARRVEALTVASGALLVATSQSLVRWDLRGSPTIKKHGADAEEGWDELRCLLAVGPHVYYGYRTAFVGGVAPPEVFSLCEAPGNVVYAGTGAGELWVVDAGGPVRKLASGPHRPVRHLAFADGELHVAANGEHHRFDGCRWTRSAPEPTAFTVDRRGRLWLLAEGRLFVANRQGVQPVPVEIERPWCLAAVGDRLWVGGRERVWSLEIR